MKIISLTLFMFISIFHYLAPDDYEPINRTLTFDNERSRLVIPVRIVNDGVDEEDEQLLSRLQLEPVEGDLPNVQVEPAEATLIIVDDDSKKTVCVMTLNYNTWLIIYRNFNWF